MSDYVIRIGILRKEEHLSWRVYQIIVYLSIIIWQKQTVLSTHWNLHFREEDWQYPLFSFLNWFCSCGCCCAESRFDAGLAQWVPVFYLVGLGPKPGPSLLPFKTSPKLTEAGKKSMTKKEVMSAHFADTVQLFILRLMSSSFPCKPRTYLLYFMIVNGPRPWNSPHPHTVLIPVVGQQSILQDEPALLVTFQIVCPFIKPTLVCRLLLLSFCHRFCCCKTNVHIFWLSFPVLALSTSHTIIVFLRLPVYFLFTIILLSRGCRIVWCILIHSVLLYPFKISFVSIYG